MLKDGFFPIECEEVSEFIAISIKERRSALRLRQYDLAERVGISLATLRKIESGEPVVAVGSVLHVLWHLGLLSSLVPIDRSKLIDRDAMTQRVRLPSFSKDDF